MKGALCTGRMTGLRNAALPHDEAGCYIQWQQIIGKTEKMTIDLRATILSAQRERDAYIAGKLAAFAAAFKLLVLRKRTSSKLA